MPARYTFSETSVFQNKDKANADKIGAELEKLTSKNGGRLQPAHVVEQARDKKSPLHRHFEWDDTKAASAYRLDQARSIIGAVRIVSSDDDEEPQRAWLSIVDRGGAAYHTIAEVTGSHKLQLALLQQAERDLLAWERRYKDLTDICEMVRKARKKIQDSIDDEKRPPL